MLGLGYKMNLCYMEEDLTWNRFNEFMRAESGFMTAFVNLADACEGSLFWAISLIAVLDFLSKRLQLICFEALIFSLQILILNIVIWLLLRQFH